MAQAAERQQYFEVTVHHDNIKAFSAALHLLQKIGKEMTIGKCTLLFRITPQFMIISNTLYRNGNEHAHIKSSE